MVRKLLKKSLWLLMALVAYLVYIIAFTMPETVERVYSQTIYPFLTQIWATITNLLPFSLGEVLLYLFAIGIVFLIFYILAGIFKPKGSKLYHICSRFLTLLIVVASVYTLFIFNWGINYARQPLSQTMGITVQDSTVEELTQVCQKLIATTNDLRGQVEEDENGVFTLKDGKTSILERTSQIYEECAPDYMNLGASVNVKGVITPNLLSSIKTTGIYSPFTFECNINMQMPDAYFPSTAAHEYSHLKGFAREDEANFIAWYVTRNSSDVEFAYSGNLLALTHAMNALYDVSPELHAQLYATICDGVQRDWQANNAYWDQFETEFAEDANAVYDSFLQYNGVSDGQQSYGRMLDLILALNREGLL